MANVTSRVKAHKSASKRKRSSPKSTPSNVNKDVEFVTVMKRPSNTKLISPEEKLKYLLQKGHLVRDKFITEPPKNIDKHNLPITKSTLISRTGRIKKKCMDNIRLFDNILKSELMIDDKAKKRKSNKNPNTNTNNNEVGISDHNITTKETAPPLDTSQNPIEPEKSKPNSRKRKSIKVVKKDNAKLSKPKVTLDKDLLFSDKVFMCDQCGKVCPTKLDIRKHIYGHLNVKPYKCTRCPKKFRYHYKMQLHVMKQHNELDDTLDHYTCDICDQSFLLRQSLDAHLTTHMHNENPYKCLYCDDKFPQFGLLLSHEKKHLHNGLYQCTICKMSYTCRKYLAAHLKGHLNIKEFMCQFCGKEFLRLNSMHRHVQVCHVGHRIQCPICKKKLKGHLTEHMRTHENKKPHKCPDCDQSFTQSTQLNVHRRCHTGAKPYPCKICGRYFSYSNGLMLHIRRHTGEKPFPCAMCPLTFSQLPHMKAHMQKIHGKENAYKCSKCEIFFKLKADLENHVKICKVGQKELSFEEKIQASVQYEEEVEVESVMSLSRMRYLLALLLTMIASKDKLKYLGFNKRLIDDLLIECLEAMGLVPCKNDKLTPLKRLKTNIELLLGTVPKEQMEKIKNEKKSTEETLEILTGEKKNDE